MTRYGHLRDTLFDISCDVLESAAAISKEEEFQHLCWMTETYVPWHPVVFLLNDLCKGSSDNDRERAWKAVDSAFAVERGLTMEEKSALWRPLERLVEKARQSTVMAGGNEHLNFTFVYLNREMQYMNDAMAMPEHISHLPMSTGAAGYEGFEEGYASPLAAMSDFANANLDFDAYVFEDAFPSSGREDFGNVYDPHSFQ